MFECLMDCLCLCFLAGYGTVSECLTAYPTPTPLIFVPRSGWPEESFLVELIERYHCGVRLSEESFVAGAWADVIISAAALRPATPASPIAIEAAMHIVSLCLALI